MEFIRNLNRVLDLFKNREKHHTKDKEKFTKEFKKRFSKLTELGYQNDYIFIISENINHYNADNILSKLELASDFFKVIIIYFFFCFHFHSRLIIIFYYRDWKKILMSLKMRRTQRRTQRVTMWVLL
jgi:hypothetical protein